MVSNILNIKYLSMMMVMCNKQHLSNISSWIYEKIKQHWGLSWKKALLTNSVYFLSLYVMLNMAQGIQEWTK